MTGELMGLSRLTLTLSQGLRLTKQPQKSRKLRGADRRLQGNAGHNLHAPVDLNRLIPVDGVPTDHLRRVYDHICPPRSEDNPPGSLMGQLHRAESNTTNLNLQMIVLECNRYCPSVKYLAWRRKILNDDRTRVYSEFDCAILSHINQVTAQQRGGSRANIDAKPILGTLCLLDLECRPHSAISQS